MPSEQLFVKAGKRYKPVTPRDGWLGFPCAGVWIVKRDFKSNSAECVIMESELPIPYDFPSYTRMAVIRNELATCICNAYDSGPMSAQDIADHVLKFLAGNTSKFEV